nr:NlpC/P60 family peptidoglycan-binding protein RipD [Mycobacterium leprae]
MSHEIAADARKHGAEAQNALDRQEDWYPMNRIYTFVTGLAMLVTSILTCSLAYADSGTRTADYQQTIDTVVQRALAQRGVPFSWAGGGVSGPTRGTGTGSNTVGFDASGLIQYAYAGAGLKLPRSSGEMYKVGQKVLPRHARRGDLIFYGPEGTESVTLYLGDEKMVEVGEVVQVSPVRSNGMAPYLVRVLGTQPTSVPQAPLQQVPTLPAPQQTPTHRAPLQHMPLQVPVRPVPVSTAR